MPALRDSRNPEEADRARPEARYALTEKQIERGLKGKAREKRVNAAKRPLRLGWRWPPLVGGRPSRAALG